MKVKFDAITKQLIQIAKYAGDAIMNIYESDELDQSIKRDGTPLTKADLASHKIITSEINNLTPNIPILSEESKKISWSKRKNWKSYWLVDPLDGTKEFINKNGEFTVNIALIENNMPVIGVVHAPFLNQTWVGNTSQNLAIKISNGRIKAIKTKPHKDGEIWKVVGSRSHAGRSLNEYLKLLGNYNLVSIGSSIKLCLVAEGSAHIYPRLSPTFEWDTAAAHAVVRSAGGNVVNAIDENIIKYNTKENLLNPHFVVKAY